MIREEKREGSEKEKDGKHTESDEEADGKGGGRVEVGDVE